MFKPRHMGHIRNLNHKWQVQIDKHESKSKSQVHAQSQIEKGKTNLDSGLSLKSHGPQLLSMFKENIIKEKF